MVFYRIRLHTFQYRKDALTFLGTRRFESFQQNLGAACHVLSERLIENNILVKISYVQRQQRYEYQFN